MFITWGFLSQFMSIRKFMKTAVSVDLDLGFDASPNIRSRSTALVLRHEMS